LNRFEVITGHARHRCLAATAKCARFLRLGLLFRRAIFLILLTEPDEGFEKQPLVRPKQQQVDLVG